MNRDKTSTIMQRLQDYHTTDMTQQRDELVALWREYHPEAAKEASVWLHPLMLLSESKQSRSRSPAVMSYPDEIWGNDVYNVIVRRYDSDPVFGTRGGMVQIGISALDGTARHDWREFQAIKNQLAGSDCEAFELYPADSRVIDPSNYYTLWCFPGMKRIRVGHGPEHREVLDAHEALAPQRALPTDPAASQPTNDTAAQQHKKQEEGQT